MTKVKICGITNADDAVFAAKLGADFLGFNFYYGSPRYIRPEAALQITETVGGNVTKIGVFVNESAGSIANTAKISGIDCVQLHGGETSKFIEELHDLTGLPIIKAHRVSKDFDVSVAKDLKAHGILLDAFTKQAFGGTGETFDWQIAAEIVRLHDRIFLAGGLSAENVDVAVRIVSPYAVDACSLLEREPGIKDNFKVEAFIKAAKRSL